MSIRNCGELGINLQKIVKRLLANDDLVKLLYYEDKDPLGGVVLTNAEKEEKIFGELIRVIPRVTEDDNNKSIIVVYVGSGRKDKSNSEFKTVNFIVDVFVPLDSWVIKDSNLRPFAILGEVQNSLEGKKINGLGEISGGDFELTRLTDKSSIYSQTFSIVEYD
jgi:hypothetical protein